MRGIVRVGRVRGVQKSKLGGRRLAHDHRAGFQQLVDDGRIRLDPAMVVETWWIAVNPAPDVAGLQFCLDELLKIEAGSAEDQANWRRFRAEIPPVFLQEIDDGVPRSRHHRQVDLFGDALGLPHRAFQRNVTLTRGHYGNAILSRFPLREVHDLDLTVPLKKRRRALVARCQIRGSHRHTILLFNCHLGLAGYERSLQLQKILQSHALRRLHRATPVIVAGDYNDVWGTLGKRWMEPAGFNAACRRAKTFPAMMPIRALDRIYYRGPLDFEHSFPARSDIARQASDHCEGIESRLFNGAELLLNRVVVAE